MSAYAIAFFVITTLLVIRAPFIRDIIFLILWPLRLPILVIGYTLMLAIYLVMKIFDPYVADIMYAGCVDDGISGNIFRRQLRSIKYVFKTRLQFFRNYRAIAEKGLFRAISTNVFGVKSEDYYQHKHYAAQARAEKIAMYTEWESDDYGRVQIEAELDKKIAYLRNLEKKLNVKSTVPLYLRALNALGIGRAKYRNESASKYENNGNK